MAITTTASGTMITGSDIATFQLMRLRRAFKLEIETGMTLSQGSTLAYLKRMGITTARTKRAAYVDLEAYCAVNGLTPLPLAD